jgi:hypothetical protein
MTKEKLEHAAKLQDDLVDIESYIFKMKYMLDMIKDSNTIPRAISIEMNTKYFDSDVFENLIACLQEKSEKMKQEFEAL